MKTILLHGLGQTSSSWKNTINTMGKSADILCPNLFDWFEDKEVCYQVLYLAFSEYCKQFSEPVNICGLSLGGILALQYGIENPDKINIPNFNNSFAQYGQFVDLAALDRANPQFENL